VEPPTPKHAKLGVELLNHLFSFRNRITSLKNSSGAVSIAACRCPDIIAILLLRIDFFRVWIAALKNEELSPPRRSKVGVSIWENCSGFRM
jgi:hypothetical protein